MLQRITIMFHLSENGDFVWLENDFSIKRKLNGLKFYNYQFAQLAYFEKDMLAKECGCEPIAKSNFSTIFR